MNKLQFLINRVVRFIMIDLDYFSTPIPLVQKISAILKTNLVITSNVVHKKKDKFPPMVIHNQKVFYDTPFATKTFLAACFDFYVETSKLSILPKKPLIVDIGANIGQFLFAIQTYVPDATVYSVEPGPETFELLKKNAKRFSRTKLFNLALGSERKKIHFFKSKKFSEWSTTKKPTDQENYSKITVQSKPGDTILSQLKQIDLLKIDVEGAELDVLAGLDKTLKKTRYLLIEFSLSRDADSIYSSKVMELLLRYNFSLFSIGRIFTYAKGEEQGAVDLIFKNRSLSTQ